MKALLYKDIVALWKYCKTFFVICLVFLAASAFQADFGFLSFYPLVFMGMLPTTLLAYDERDKWDKFALAAPCTRRQIVTGKYLVGLVLEGGTLLLTALAAYIRMVRAGSFDMADFCGNLLVSLILAMSAPTLMLPAVFKLGSEKGRIAYAAVIGVILSAGTTGILITQEQGMTEFALGVWPSVLAIGAVVLMYPASWALSVRWYERREF